MKTAESTLNPQHLTISRPDPCSIHVFIGWSLVVQTDEWGFLFLHIFYSGPRIVESHMVVADGHSRRQEDTHVNQEIYRMFQHPFFDGVYHSEYDDISQEIEYPVELEFLLSGHIGAGIGDLDPFIENHGHQQQGDRQAEQDVVDSCPPLPSQEEKNEQEEIEGKQVLPENSLEEAGMIVFSLHVLRHLEYPVGLRGHRHVRPALDPHHEEEGQDDRHGQHGPVR